MKSYLKTLCIVSIVGILTGCSNHNSRNLAFSDIKKISSEKSQLQVRQAQTKRFFNTNQDELIKVIVNTMQDELFYITFLDNDSGIISARGKKEDLNIDIVSSINPINSKDFDIRISVNIRDNDDTSILEYNELYNYFFDKLRKSLFLEQNLYKKEKQIILDLPKKDKKSYSFQIIEID